MEAVPEPEGGGNGGADEQAGGEGEVEAEVIAFDGDVSGEAADGEAAAFHGPDGESGEGEEESCGDHDFAHDSIVAGMGRGC